MSFSKNYKASNCFPKSNVYTHYMDVSPAMAIQWLGGNIRNRRIDQKKVQNYCDEMMAGKWETSHQGIAFDTTNTLVDGQHRLMAIIRSGCSIHTAVTFGLAPKMINKIDSGKPRSKVDRFILTGSFGQRGISPAHVAAMHAAVAGLNCKPNLSDNEEYELMQKHLDAVRFAVSHISSNNKGISVAYVRAVIVRAWYSVDHDSLEQFCRLLSTGLIQWDEDSIIVRIRDYLMGVGYVQNPDIQREIYAKLQRVLLVWLNGEKRKKIFPVTQEHFPLPEELQLVHECGVC